MEPRQSADPDAQVLVELGVAGAEPEELADLATGLRRELSQLDVERVDPLVIGEAPAGARAVELLALGSLVVTLARNAGVLADVVRAVQGWLGRDSQRSVKLELGGDTIEVSGVSSSEQERLIAVWLERHSERDT